MQTDKPTLFQQIMNLPCICKLGDVWQPDLWKSGYGAGHRDARHAAAELVAASSLPPPGGEPWMPIETAPKDRTPVIVWWDGRIVGEARYIPEEDMSDFGWWWANEGPGDYHAEKLSPEPTHWQPLPQPPVHSVPAHEARPNEHCDSASPLPAHQVGGEPQAMPEDLAKRIAIALDCGVLWTERSEAHPRMKRALADFLAWLASPTPASGATGAGGGRDTATGVLGMESSGWVRLVDSDWVNIVNAPTVLDPLKDKEEAVREAVKLTEARLKALNAGPWCCPSGRANGVEVCRECADVSAAYLAAMSPHQGGRDNG
jgi:hypothetical protein